MAPWLVPEAAMAPEPKPWIEEDTNPVESSLEAAVPDVPKDFFRRGSEALPPAVLSEALPPAVLSEAAGGPVVSEEESFAGMEGEGGAFRMIGV